MEIQHVVRQRDREIVLDTPILARLRGGDVREFKTMEEWLHIIELLNESYIKDDFGEVLTMPTGKDAGQFMYHFNHIVAEIKGFASFNNGKHNYIQLDDMNETVSIRTKGGKLLTVALCSCFDEEFCFDIQLHNHSKLEPVDNAGPVPQFKVMGLHLGGTPVKSTVVTLLTLPLD